MHLKTAIYRLAGSSLPLCSSLGFGPSPDKIGIIMVHGVYDSGNIAGVPMPPSGVLLEAFKANILGLSGYSFISMDEAVAMLKGDLHLRKRCLVLTFDDSLKAHAEVVAPVLLKWGIPATFYLSTDILDHQRPYWWLRLDYALEKLNGKPVFVELPGGESVTIVQRQMPTLRRKVKMELMAHLKPAQCDRFVGAIESQLGIAVEEMREAYPYAHAMSWADARKLARTGFTLGSHTCSHPNLTLLSPDELRSEFENSKKLIEEQCGVACRHFCYPHGLYSDRLYSAIASSGYVSAVTTENKAWNREDGNLFQLKRFGIPRRPYELPFLLTGLRPGIWA